MSSTNIEDKEVKIQPECRCSNDFPRNENINSTFCITNSAATPGSSNQTILNKSSRLNDFAHPLAFINDGNFKTSWISCILSISSPIVIEIDLYNGVYLLQRIEIFFTSLPPTSLTIEKYYNLEWVLVQEYSLNCDEQKSANCVQLPQ